MANKKDVAGSGITGTLQVVQASLHDPQAQLVAASIGAVLGFSAAVWSYFGDKRNKELFDQAELVAQVTTKVQQSDDFASFVFDVWQKHNLESSEERRKMLKKFLEEEAYKDKNDFENFSKVALIVQNINLRALKLLSIIHSDEVRKRKRDPNNAADAHLTIEELVPFVQKVENMHEQDIEYFMNELTSYGLLSPLYGRFGGTFYIETKLGFILMDYIKS
jgi:hypothetical protein